MEWGIEVPRVEGKAAEWSVESGMMWDVIRQDSGLRIRVAGIRTAKNVVVNLTV